VLRENSLPTDFVGFLSFLASSFPDVGFAYDRDRSVSQSGNLRLAQSDGRIADSRVTTAARGVQAQVEETLAEKQGPSILVVALKNLERLETGVDPLTDHATLEWTKRQIWGQRLPNAFSLYDMIGNMPEWCSDCWDEHYYAQSPCQNPEGRLLR
jgi:hypothetical protein